MGEDNVLKHIAIIPDGNRRWAKKRGLPTVEGHRVGAEKTLPDLIEKAIELKVQYFTFWALSPENIAKREKGELNNLFYLLKFFLKNRLNDFQKKGAKLKVIGNFNLLPKDLLDQITKAEEKTKNNKVITVQIGIGYGGRDEIIRAIKKIQDLKNLENFSQLLDTTGIPDPDLIIRTGGEHRLSGFMLWQSEYSELYFSDKYFPDFTPEELVKAINNFEDRQRRFGK